ncbi:MAG TPA: 23S rRNA (adenine(2503)-C(2))-methyltransferase RlmN [Rectinemataceae bacterium]|nr:23S rRNA (adenine(2503)-C(2))-methyltransferase RlmN [Rectinemataceae bacterium]
MTTMPMGDGKPAIYLSGLYAGEIRDLLGYEQGFRASQIYGWIVRGVGDFSGMTNLPASERERLSTLFGGLRSSAVSSELKDDDGSLKLQIRLRDGAAVECVLLEDIEGRKTACLSSQVGCPMGCKFCKTGQLGFLRNLGPDEILEQFYFLKERRGFISNVVFMGMGEPLLNLDSVRKAISLLSDKEGIGMSLRKITISTSGIVPGILDLAANGPCVRLAVSLTTADEEMRSDMMPVNRTWNLAALKNALLDYQEKTGERITLEVVLAGNRNADAESARALVRWIRPMKAQVNLIPWNVVAGLPFEEPTSGQVRAFADVLVMAGLTAVQRMHRGRGVMGACGQLGDTLKIDPKL